jgi:hypothetical protein
MARRSPRKKAISPINVVDSDDEDFQAVASDVAPDDRYFFFWVVNCKVFSSYLLL